MNAVVSGGGSGHEPSHAGWVADGMLTAAVCGSVFASPSTKSVLAAIMHVTGAAGCLVIIKNCERRESTRHDTPHVTAHGCRVTGAHEPRRHDWRDGAL